MDDRVMEGTLMEQVEEAMTYFRERLQTRFEVTGKPQRKVIWEYPLEALREAVINAVCHRDFVDNGHTQIRIYDERLVIWNPGNLPAGLSLDMLKKEHRSIPRNRLIAKVFFYAGLIEQWGSGIGRIIRATRESGLPDPAFEEAGGFRIVFRRAKTAQVTPQVTVILKAASRDRNAAELQKFAGLKDRVHFLHTYLTPLLAAGLLERTIPDKPRSRLQKYRLTAAGHALPARQKHR